MRTICAGLLLGALAVGQSPHHVFKLAEPLTGASALPAREVARDFLRQMAPDYGLSDGDLQAAYVAREYRSDHNGITHTVWRQRFQGLEVENAWWTVNVDAAGRVINAGGRLSPGPAAGAAPPERVSALRAVRAAARAVNSRVRFFPFAAADGPRGPRFARSGFAAAIDGEPVWYDVNGTLRSAWKFFVLDADGIHRYAVIVDSATDKVLAKQALTLAQAPAKGMVFERGSPQPAPSPGVLATAPPALVDRTVQSFAGDPAASPRGWVSDTETGGNNVIAGGNPLGFDCVSSLECFVRPVTSSAAARDFSFPLQLGDGAPNPTAFPDAAAANLFYWANRAHDLFYQLGFDEQAGNYQQDNFGKGGVGGDRIYAYSQFGSQAARAAQVNNSAFFSWIEGEDGSPAEILFLLNAAPAGFYDNDLDASIILHEYTHAVSSRLVPRLGEGFQGAAMGEGWSDFFALEFLTPEGAPVDGAYPLGEYAFQLFGAGIRTRPYSTSMDVNPLTYASLAHVIAGPEVHADGEIWAEALWEMRAALIRQLGEKEGRRRTRLLVIDGMKLSPPEPSMLDMRDSILLADRADFQGASQNQIWAAFARRGMGVLAQARSANSVHIAASFETSSPAGSLRLFEDSYTIQEPVRVVLQDGNVAGNSVLIQLTGSSGDLENLVLKRQGPVFIGSIGTDYGPVSRSDGILQLIPGDSISAYYLDSDTGKGGAALVQTNVPAAPDYAVSTHPNAFAQTRGEFLDVSGAPGLYELPFDFPYFGRNYAGVWVHDNGLLSFDLPDFAPCTDAASLALVNGIAPMWMPLTIDGGAQPDEGVFVTTGDDSVTFRWAAETAADFPVAAPQPVNFEATLWRDGRIVFSYGPGNRNLTGGSQWFGCSVGTATVGISNGHETYVNPALTHDGQGTLENARTLYFDPPFNNSTLPAGQLDTPADGEAVVNAIRGTGIAYDADPEGFLRRVDVLIDGIAQDTANLHLSRADFCAGQQVPGCPLVGFGFTEPLGFLNLAPGDHTLQVRATNSRGGFADIPEKALTFQVAAGAGNAPYGKIERPADGAEVAGIIAVRGYAAVDDARILAVDVMVDGVTVGRASYGAARTDVCGALAAPPPNCPRVGFSFNLDTQSGEFPISNGKHTLSVRVIDDAGRFTQVPDSPVAVTVNNDNVLPQAVLLSPKPNDKLSGTVPVTGYAWDTDDRIDRVELIVDGVDMGPMRYGLPNPDACATLQAGDCPNIGFSLDLNTRLFANGPHTLMIVVQARAGAAITVPANSAWGYNVFFAN